MEGRRLILTDGTVIEDGQAGYAQAHLWCYFSGFTMQQAAQMFFDPAKTEKIVFQFGDMSEEWEGFTNCTSISVDVDGMVSVCMVRGSQNV